MLIVTMSVSILSAGASHFQTQADSLNEMNLFLGTNQGYELDRSATRAEAAVMVVRLLGREAQVKAGSYSHPFTDVPAWADNYVGFLYENGLTKGTSSTTFSTDLPCTSQMYTAFVLRTLGYTEDNNSYVYAQALEFAQNLGLIDSSISESGDFIRDDMVAISYEALFQSPKGNSNSTLLKELVASNAVSSDKAQKYLDLSDAYQQYLTMVSEAKINTSAEVQQKITMDISMLGETLPTSQDSYITIVKDGEEIIMKSEDVSSFMGETTESTSYYSDGWLYTSSDEGKYKAEMDIGDIGEIIGISAQKEPLYLFSSVSKSATDTETTYTIEYSPEMLSNYLDTIPDMADFTDTIGSGDIQINTAKTITVFDAEGKLKSQTVTIDLSASTVIEDETIEMSVAVNASTTIVKTDDTISITLPSDLNEYEAIN